MGGRLGLTRQFSDMMPEDKAEVIEMLKREGNVVATVGDGIDDSVALDRRAEARTARRAGAHVSAAGIAEFRGPCGRVCGTYAQSRARPGAVGNISLRRTVHRAVIRCL